MAMHKFDHCALLLSHTMLIFTAKALYLVTIHQPLAVGACGAHGRSTMDGAECPLEWVPQALTEQLAVFFCLYTREPGRKPTVHIAALVPVT